MEFLVFCLKFYFPSLPFPKMYDVFSVCTVGGSTDFGSTSDMEKHFTIVLFRASVNALYEIFDT